jgi:hypothetical protein
MLQYANKANKFMYDMWICYISRKPPTCLGHLLWPSSGRCCTKDTLPMCTYTILRFYIYVLKYVTIYFTFYLFGIRALRFDVTHYSVRTCDNSSCVAYLTTLLKLFSFGKALIRRAGRHTHGRGENRNACTVMVGKLDEKRQTERSEFRDTLRISCLADKLFCSQDGLCPMELVNV